MEDMKLDAQGNFVLTPGGDVATVTDMDCLTQDVRHRLITFPGDLWLHTEYGAELPTFIQAIDSEMARLELAQLIELALRQDDRISPTSISVEIIEWTRQGIRVSVGFQPSEAYLEDSEADDLPPEGGITLTISQNGIQMS